MKKNKVASTIYALLALAVVSCSDAGIGVGNYSEAKSLQKMVRDKHLTTAKISTVFGGSSTDRYLLKNISFMESMVEESEQLSIGDDEVRDLTVKVATEFEPKNIARTTCSIFGVIDRENRNDSQKRCEQKVNKCTEFVEKNVPWDEIKLSIEMAINALKDCDSMTMGQIADCFVLMNEFYIATDEVLSCELSSVQWLEKMIMKRLDQNKTDFYEKINQCSEKMAMCQIKSKINFDDKYEYPFNKDEHIDKELFFKK